MSSNRFAIDAFKGAPGTLEIVALGEIRRQPNAAMEAEIEVLLASDLDHPAFDPERDLHRRWVACGQLDLLNVGSRWNERARVGETQASRTSGNYALDDVELLGVGSDKPQLNRRRLPTRPMAAAPCFVLRRHDWVKGMSGPRKVLIPQIELVRTLFGVSSRMLIELIDGLRDPRVADRGILDRRNSRRMSDGTVRLSCWRKPSNEEAMILAAMVADPALMRLHDEVFQQLVVQKDYREDKPTWPKVTWPFADPINLELEGWWFEREDGFPRFLVTRIHEIGLRLALTRIEVYYPGNVVNAASERLPPPTGRVRSTNARLVVLTTGRAASPSRRPAEVRSAPVVIPASLGVSIEFVANGGRPHPKTSTLGEVPREDGSFSTASRESGTDPAVGRAEIRRLAGVDAVAAAHLREKTLRSTWEALSAAAAVAGWRLTPYPVGGGYDGKARDGGFDFRREGILAGLNLGGRHVVIVDERAAPDDPCSLGILVNTGATAVTWLDIQRIRMVHNSLRGHWGSHSVFLAGFSISSVRRRAATLDKPNAYAALLRTRIAGAISEI